MKNAFPNISFQPSHSAPVRLLAALLLVAGMAASSANAQNNFDVRFGESPRLLLADAMHADGMMGDTEHSNLIMEDSCIDPLTRNRLRNRFAVLVENKSTSGNSLTSIAIDLVEMGYAFGDGDTLGDGFTSGMLALDAGLSSEGVSFTARHGLDASEVIVDFAGLTAGLMAILRLDLDPTATGPDVLKYPDYREILLGANGHDEALLDVSFSAGRNFADLPLKVGDFGTTVNPNMFEAYHGGSISGRLPDGTPNLIGGSTETIPEPTSAALAVLAAMTMTLRLRSRSL